MRTLRAPDVSQEDLAKPIPSYDLESGGKEDVHQKKLDMMVESASEYEGGDNQDEAHPADEVSEEEDDGDAAIASAPAIAASVGANNCEYTEAHTSTYAQVLTISSALPPRLRNPHPQRTDKDATPQPYKSQDKPKSHQSQRQGARAVKHPSTSNATPSKKVAPSTLSTAASPP